MHRAWSDRPNEARFRSSIERGVSLARGDRPDSTEQVLSAEFRQVTGGLYRLFGPGTHGHDLADQTALGQFVRDEPEDKGDEHGGQDVPGTSHPRPARGIESGRGPPPGPFPETGSTVRRRYGDQTVPSYSDAEAGPRGGAVGDVRGTERKEDALQKRIVVSSGVGLVAIVLLALLPTVAPTSVSGRAAPVARLADSAGLITASPGIDLGATGMHAVSLLVQLRTAARPTCLEAWGR